MWIWALYWKKSKGKKKWVIRLFLLVVSYFICLKFGGYSYIRMLLAFKWRETPPPKGLSNRETLFSQISTSLGTRQFQDWLRLRFNHVEQDSSDFYAFTFLPSCKPAIILSYRDPMMASRGRKTTPSSVHFKATHPILQTGFRSHLLAGLWLKPSPVSKKHNDHLDQRCSSLFFFF